jgi:hypothetical protein
MRVAGRAAGVIPLYAPMPFAAVAIEFRFQAAGLVRSERNARIVEASITFNHTTVLNLLFLAVAAVLVRRFLKTGGPGNVENDVTRERRADCYPVPLSAP